MGVFGFASLLAACVLGATALPAAAVTFNGTMISGTFSSNTPIYRYGFQQLPNEASLSCGAGSTTAPNGGPQGNSLECVFPAPVTTGSFTLIGTTPWPDSVTVNPFASTDNATYVTLPPVTLTAPSPAPGAGSTPAPKPGATKPNTPKSGEAVKARGMNSTRSSPWFWVLLAVGIALVLAGVFVEDDDELAEDEEDDDGEPEELEVEIPPKCLEQQAAVAAAQLAAQGAAMVASAAQSAEQAAQAEFDAARAALDEAERQNNAPLPPIESGGPIMPDDVELVRSLLYRALTNAANRQGAARLNLELAQSKLSEAQAQAWAAQQRLLQARERLAECLGLAGPVAVPEESPVTDRSAEIPPVGPPIIIPPPTDRSAEVPPVGPPIIIPPPTDRSAEIPPVGPPVFIPPPTDPPPTTPPGVDPCQAERAQLAAAQYLMELFFDEEGLDFANAAANAGFLEAGARGEFASKLSGLERAVDRAQQALDLCEAANPAPPDPTGRVEIR